MTNTTGGWDATTLLDAANIICTGLGDDLVRFNASGAEEVERIRHLLKPDMVVLDFGGGIGRVARHLAPLVKAVIVFDVSSAMLNFGREWCQQQDNVFFHLCDSEPRLPLLQPGTLRHQLEFDLIVSHMTFYHLYHDTGNYDAWMDEMWRVLKPGGLFRYDVDIETKYPSVDDAKWLVLERKRLPGWNGHPGDYWLLQKSGGD